MLVESMQALLAWALGPNEDIGSCGGPMTLGELKLACARQVMPDDAEVVVTFDKDTGRASLSLNYDDDGGHEEMGDIDVYDPEFEPVYLKRVSSAYTVGKSPN